MSAVAVKPWSVVTISNGAERVTLTVTSASGWAFCGVPLGADAQRPLRGPDTRDNRVVFLRPEWRLA